VGLDPEISRLPPGFRKDASGVIDFNRELIAATSTHVLGYKLNFAFYEALGADGRRALAATRDAVPASLLTIADAKRGDIAETSRMYACSIFDQLGFDAVTLAPYVGQSGLEPFLEYQDRGSFILCRTSNRDSSLQTTVTTDGSLYEVIAREVHGWGKNAGLVVGATDTDALRRVRAIAPKAPFLVPGVGAQGATIQETFRVAADSEGRNALVSASRSIMYASTGAEFAAAAASEAETLHQAMTRSVASPRMS
jgi:orotidine-5'-phosphate decarboxylase